jgi:hypothetical protein
MEETLEQKKRRLFGKQYLAEYLTIIKRITLYKQKSDIKLMSISETDIVINNNLSLEKANAFRIPFDNKTELRRMIMERCAKNEPIYLYTDLSKDCGLVFLNSIDEFNFEFNFEDEPVGLIILIGLKSNYKILLDFYEENGEKYIEIEYYK